MGDINIHTVLIPNGIAIVLLLTMVASTHRVLYHTILDEKLFYMMVLSNLMQCVAEIAAYAVDGLPGNYFRVIALLINSFLYINNILFAFLWTMYADYKVFMDAGRMRRIYSWVGIPALIVIAGSVINLFVPVFYRLTQDNVYERTSLYIIPYIFTYFYLLYGVILVYTCRKNAKKYLFLPAIIFMIPIFIGSVLQFLFMGLSLVWIGVAIALVSLYINVQNEVSYTDSLSGLFTRDYMYQYLRTESRRFRSDQKLAGIMLDVDKFKKINDTYGHLQGDDAIKTAGEMLRRVMSDKGIAIRFAGDEFILLQWVERTEDVQQTLDRIEEEENKLEVQKEKPYILRFSKGYSIFDAQTDTIDSFLGRIDAAMYLEKNEKRMRAAEIQEETSC